MNSNILLSTITIFIVLLILISIILMALRLIYVRRLKTNVRRHLRGLTSSKIFISIFWDNFFKKF